MLSISELPDWIRFAQDGLYGDVEWFLEMYEIGFQEAAWHHLVACNAVCNEEKVAGLIH